MANRIEGSPELDDEAVRALAEQDPNRAYRLERRIEYAARLQPIADADLPPALRHAYRLQANPESRGPPKLLHFGFLCPTPHGTSYIETMSEKVYLVNKKIGDPKTLQVRSANMDRPVSTFVVVVYSNDAEKDPVHTPERLERIHQELRKAFGDPVERPMWYWDLGRHGAGIHKYAPFDKAYPDGHPGEC